MAFGPGAKIAGEYWLHRAMAIDVMISVFAFFDIWRLELAVHLRRGSYTKSEHTICSITKSFNRLSRKSGGIYSIHRHLGQRLSGKEGEEIREEPKMAIWQDTIPQNLLFHPENLVLIATDTTQNNARLRLSINVPVRVEYWFDPLGHHMQ
ncbi:hypothetical protein C8R44DRAFT_726801 [Mycena epipterygia]|nr:hypothetical protein C8R44DRAFT_726801 [Mycena epipterygia]